MICLILLMSFSRDRRKDNFNRFGKDFPEIALMDYLFQKFHVRKAIPLALKIREWLATSTVFYKSFFIHLSFVGPSFNYHFAYCYFYLEINSRAANWFCQPSQTQFFAGISATFFINDSLRPESSLNWIPQEIVWVGKSWALRATRYSISNEDNIRYNGACSFWHRPGPNNKIII